MFNSSTPDLLKSSSVFQVPSSFHSSLEQESPVERERTQAHQGPPLPFQQRQPPLSASAFDGIPKRTGSPQVVAAHPPRSPAFENGPRNQVPVAEKLQQRKPPRSQRLKSIDTSQWSRVGQVSAERKER